MGRLEDLQAFARVVDARGFSGAARLLGTTKSAVSKQVVRLEDQLGTRLLHRTTRSVSPTAEGRAVYERALRLLDDARALDDELAGRRDEPSGVLRLSTSTAFGNLQFTALAAEFCARHPQLQLVLGLNDRYVDLAEEGFDVVLRLTHEEIADAVGVARETVSVALMQLRRKNAVKTGRNRLTFSPEQLERSFSGGRALVAQ